MNYAPYLDWIHAQQPEMLDLLIQWAHINSGTRNLTGLAQLTEQMIPQLAGLADTVMLRSVAPLKSINSRGVEVETPLAPAILASRRLDAPRKVVLSIHMDTVYGPESEFQSTHRIDGQRLGGPAVADAKGGLVVLIFALKTLERFAAETGNQQLGWQVLINSDEEVGSPGSAALFREVAEWADYGLLFEPALPHGGLISSRKGSGNFSVIVRGLAAHAGRDFEAGRNAIVAASEVTRQLHQLNKEIPGMTLNVARIEGGGPTNVVPDLGIVHFNIRYLNPSDEDLIRRALQQIVTDVEQQSEVQTTLWGDFSAPPKIATPPMTSLMNAVDRCAGQLGLHISWQASGGVCDGNRLAAYGVPNVDTLGVRGGNIHSPEEFMYIDSLAERAQLTALLLMQLADGTLMLEQNVVSPAY